MRGNSILRHAFKIRSSTSSSSGFLLNQNYSLSAPKNGSSIPRKPFPVYTLQNLTPSRPYSKSTSGTHWLDKDEPEPPVPQKVELKEEDYAFLLEKNEGPPRKPIPDPPIDMQNLPRSLQQSLNEIYQPFVEEEPPEPPNFVPISSEEEFDTALSKAESESVPTIFYFTATWCAPCRLIGPIMVELARRNPTLTINKMDIDEKALASKLSAHNITSVPTVFFYKGGKKEDEVIGADAGRIVRAVMKLYDMKPRPKSSEDTVKDSEDRSCEEK